MKNLIRLVLLLVMLSLSFGCALFEDSEAETVEMTDLEIADDFDYETERWVEVSLTALFAGTFYIKDMEDNMLYKGLIDPINGFNQKIKLPTAIEEVKLQYHEVESIEKNYRIYDNEIVYSFVPQYR